MVVAVAADADLARVAPGLQYAQAAVLGLGEPAIGGFRQPQAEPLARAGVAVLHPGIADVGLAEARRGAEPARGFKGGQVGFLDLDAEMLAGAGQVKAQFLAHLEIIGAVLEQRVIGGGRQQAGEIPPAWPG